MPRKKTQQAHSDVVQKNNEIIAKKSREFHTRLCNLKDEIEDSETIENPLERIKALRESKKALTFLNNEINEFLKDFQKTKHFLEEIGTSIQESSLVNSNTNIHKLPLLKDVRDINYAINKNKLIKRLSQKIHSDIQDAKLESTFTKAFYVFDGFDENNTPNQKRIKKTYFWGVPAKENKNNVTYFFEWLSYFLGGFIVTPIKNILKGIFEYLPNYLATYFENRAQNALRDPSHSFTAGIDYLVSSMLKWPLKGIWVLGRAVFSPVTSAGAGWRTGFKFGSALAVTLGGGETAQTVSGAVFGILLGAPSLLIGLAATIVTIIAAPPSLIYLIGKIPLFGAQAATWLTATSETLSALRLVSNIFHANQAIASTVVPSIAASAKTGAGLMAFMQLTNAAKGILHSITNVFYMIFKLKRQTAGSHE